MVNILLRQNITAPNRKLNVYFYIAIFQASGNFSADFDFPKTPQIKKPERKSNSNCRPGSCDFKERLFLFYVSSVKVRDERKPFCILFCKSAFGKPPCPVSACRIRNIHSMFRAKAKNVLHWNYRHVCT